MITTITTSISVNALHRNLIDCFPFPANARPLGRIRARIDPRISYVKNARASTERPTFRIEIRKGRKSGTNGTFLPGHGTGNKSAVLPVFAILLSKANNAT
jgi:hypothetical protein